jgi:hypothetical protein
VNKGCSSDVSEKGALAKVFQQQPNAQTKQIQSPPAMHGVLVLSNGVMTVDTREKVSPGSTDYEAYQLECKKVAEEGADAKVTLHVVDQSGNGVTNADVSIVFFCNNRRETPLLGKTDTNGCFAAEGRLTGNIIYSVKKKGYYETFSKFGLNGKGVRCFQNGRWIPWNPTFQVILKEMRKPIPMIAKKVESKVPKYDVPIGFDFKVGDWVTPYGKGLVADMTLTYSEVEREKTWCKYDFKVEFLSPSGGAYIQKKDSYSILNSANEAASEGYFPSYSFVYERTDSKIIQDVKITTDDCLVFRSRTETDEKGVIKTANYGKIYGPFKFAYGRNRKVVFTYYFNPTPNDRNLEFDGKNNLLKGLSSLEEVYTP